MFGKRIFCISELEKSCFELQMSNFKYFHLFLLFIILMPALQPLRPYPLSLRPLSPEALSP